MLTLFPGLLVYSFFAPTLVRVAGAIIFLYLAYYHFQNKDELAQTRFPMVGAGMWIPWLSVLVELVVGAGLFFGYYTQVSAMVGAIVALKYFVWSGKYPHFFALSRATTFLLFVICISLLLTGAGALAFDLPL